MARTILSLLFLAVSVAVLSPLALLAGILAGHPRPMHAFARWIMRNLLRVAGVRLTVDGREKLGADIANTLIVSNHASHVDPPALYTALGVDLQALAKQEVFAVPLMGAVLRRAGCVPIVRSDRSKASSAIEAMTRGLKAGGTFMAFPEGTRTRDGSLQPFKRGVFVAAIEARSRVVPVAITGTFDRLPRHRAALRPGPVHVKVLDPIDAGGYSYADRDRLATDVRARIAGALPEPATMEAAFSA